MPQIRRRRLIVDAKLQGALLTHVVLYWLYCLITVLLIALVWIVFAKRPSTSADLVEQLWGNFGPVLVGSVLILPLVLLDFLRISNRLAGPMVRLRREMKALANGEVSRSVQLREGDFWLEFAEDWNQALARHSCSIDNPTAADNSPAPIVSQAAATRNANSSPASYADTISA